MNMHEVTTKTTQKKDRWQSVLCNNTTKTLNKLWIGFGQNTLRQVFLCRQILHVQLKCGSTYCGHDDDQELLSLELLHRAHLDVRQAHLTQQQSDLLTLGTN